MAFLLCIVGLVIQTVDEISANFLGAIHVMAASSTLMLLAGN
jgi:hypothetical protein